jgi:hypothetical protein
MLIIPYLSPMGYPANLPSIGKGYWEKAPLRGVLLPRRIWLDDSDQTLCWEWFDDSRTEPHRGHARRGLLEDFLSLHTESERSILAFARTYGPLFLCKHKRPYTHNPKSAFTYPNVEVEREPFALASLSESNLRGWSYDGCLPTGREPIRVWKDLSHRVSMLFSVASALREGNLAKRKMMEALLLPGFRLVGFGPEDLPRTLDEQRILVSAHTQALLSVAGLRLHFDWSVETPRCYLGSPTVYGLVVYQLLVEIMGGTDLTICSHCGEPFFPKSRRRPSGRNHWCYKDTCQKASRATANRAYRKKKRGDVTP